MSPLHFRAFVFFVVAAGILVDVVRAHGLSSPFRLIAAEGGDNAAALYAGTVPILGTKLQRSLLQGVLRALARASLKKECQIG